MGTSTSRVHQPLQLDRRDHPATGANRSTYLGAGNQAWPFVPVTGPEGNIWTTEPRDPAVTTGNDKLSISTPRVDTSMSPPAGGPIYFLEPTLTGNADPQGIAAGPTDTSNNPGEALWVAEFTANKIARVTRYSPRAARERWSPSTRGLSTRRRPQGIALGLTATSGSPSTALGKVGRLTLPSTLDGAPDIDEFSLPTANSQPWGIASGPDGNLWIAESATGKVAQDDDERRGHG